MDCAPLLSLQTDDLLIRILSFLKYESDHKSFRLVCKAFFRVGLLHHTHLRILRLELMPTLLSKFPRVYSLDLSACPQINDGAVTMLVRYGFPDWSRRLRKLVLSCYTGLRSTGLEMLVKSCPFLDSVDVSYCCDFGDREAAALSCGGSLKDLNLDKLRVGHCIL